MSVYYEQTYVVGTRDVDLFGHCRPSAMLGYLQDVGTQAALNIGFSREEMLERHHAFWMLARIWYQLDKPLTMGEPVTIRTWHRGGKGAILYRDFDLYQNGQWIGEAVSAWVLADWESHKLCKLSHLEEFQRNTGGELCKSKTLGKLRHPTQMDLAEERLLHYSDTDINGHVNNARYADFTCDALHLEQLGQGRFVSSLQIGFLQECKAGETLPLYTASDETGYFVRGGDKKFEAHLRLCPLDKDSTRG